MCPRQTWQVGQIKHLPASRARMRQKCGGGVMDWRQSQDRAAAGLSALQLDASRQPQPSLSSGPRRHGEMARGVKLEPQLSRVGFCFMANYRWLLALIPSSPLLLSLPSITPPPAPSCCSPVEKVLLMTEEGYPIYLRAKPFRASSPCVPAERRLPEEKNNNTHT